jgi:hypothetical protein
VELVMACQLEVFCQEVGFGGGAAPGEDRQDCPGSGLAALGGDRAGLDPGPQRAESAAMFAATVTYAREVIHAFNEKGFAALDPEWSGADHIGSAPTPAS